MTKEMLLPIIIQARMSSERLPGKVMHQVNGKPILQYLIERMDHCSQKEGIIVATSTEVDDDAIVMFCKKRNISFYRGSLENVSSRFREILDRYNFDAFVRVSGDSPLLDQRIVDRAIELFCGSNVDIVTNVSARSYPYGQSVEVIKSATFRKGCNVMESKEDLEHVTMFFYRNRLNFKILNFASEVYYGDVHLTVDTARDLEIFTEIVQAMKKPHWEYTLQEIIELYQTVIRDLRA